MSLPTTGAGRSIWSVQFYAESDGINIGSGANIDDLPAADCTLEGYFMITSPPITGAVYLISKLSTGANGWGIWASATGALTVSIRLATDQVLCSTAEGAIEWGHWYHVAADFDIGTITGRLFVDGELHDTDVGIGVYQTAAAINCVVNGFNTPGAAGEFLSVGPIRLSDSRRYTGASFDPPRRINWPANDANAQLITRMNDGAGATVTDYSGNGYDGTITFGASTRWYNDPV